MAIDFTVSSDLVTPALLLKIRAGLAKHLGLAAERDDLFLQRLGARRRRAPRTCADLKAPKDASHP